MASHSASPEPSQNPYFLTTHWSVVLAARAGDSNARTALGALCQAYWYPLYAYVRRRGYSVEDAQDLTQEFFARLLGREWLSTAEESKGRFRTFLLTAMERFLANEWDKAHAQKRGAGVPNVPIQLDDAETRYGVEPADPRTPEQAFEYRWAVTLLDQVVQHLGAEYQERGQTRTFELLKCFLISSPSADEQTRVAVELGISAGTLRVMVHRLRQRYRQLLRNEISNTVASTSEIDAEMRYLLAVLSR